mmetsp:Transcript_122018/g.352564  ORF Transcript_122018/g.352564 Transcript_122018/m.352564 type:complete len:207 (-) Transcript_122018:45-665(-)
MPSNEHDLSAQEAPLVVCPPENQFNNIERKEEIFPDKKLLPAMRMHKRDRHRHHVGKDHRGHGKRETRPVDELQALRTLRGRAPKCEVMVHQVDLLLQFLNFAAMLLYVLGQLLLAVGPISRHLAELAALRIHVSSDLRQLGVEPLKLFLRPFAHRGRQRGRHTALSSHFLIVVVVIQLAFVDNLHDSVLIGPHAPPKKGLEAMLS